MKKVLLVAGLDERYYYDAFLRACNRRNMLVYVFDPSRVPSDASIAVTMDAQGHVSGVIDVLLFDIHEVRHVRMSMNDIDVAWHLRESSCKESGQNLSIETVFSQDESRAAVHSLMSVLDCAWVNHKSAVDAVSYNKLYQQQCAARCGLLVPSTNITNDPETLQTAAKLSGELLLKSIGRVQIQLERRYSVYSERFSHEKLLHSDVSIRGCPVFAQQYIEKKYEYRVMVVGRRVLACRIDSQASEKTETDWRHYDFDHVEHVMVELPVYVVEKLLRFMEAVQLQYGAIDLIETPQGDFVFLEVNPSGQWHWIAKLAGLHVEEAVCDMLEVL